MVLWFWFQFDLICFLMRVLVLIFILLGVWLSCRSHYWFGTICDWFMNIMSVIVGVLGGDGIL